MRLVLLLSLTVALSGCSSYHDDMRARHRTVAKALMVVVRALEAFHAGHGEYPVDLEKLIPKYLPAMPALPPYASLLNYQSLDAVPHMKGRTQRRFLLSVHIGAAGEFSSLQYGEDLVYFAAQWRSGDNIYEYPDPQWSYSRSSLRYQEIIDHDWVRCYN